MTLLIHGKGFWQHSPYGPRARELVLKSMKVGTLVTHSNTLKLECNTCGSNTLVKVEERQGEWGWGKCATCEKPYIVFFI